MKNRIITFWIYASVVILLIYIGFVGPWLISEPSDMAVILGIVLGILILINAYRSITFGTVEGMNVNADVGITYHVDPDKVSLLFQKYRKGVDEITNTYLRNMVRDALVNEASRVPIETVYGTGKADLIKAVQSDVTAQVQGIGIVIEKVYWIGELHLPQQVTASINAKIQATQNAQKAENEVATAKAEAQKAVANAEGEAQARLTVARADAQAIQLKGDALRQNPGIIQLNAVEKWNGVLPQYSGGGAVPFLNINGESGK